LDSLIESAPEVSELLAPAEAPPWKSEKPEVEAKAPEPTPPAPSLDDSFHQDPLIQAALVKFEGKLVLNN
jgi:hypothetical protein